MKLGLQSLAFFLTKSLKWNDMMAAFKLHRTNVFRVPIFKPSTFHALVCKVSFAYLDMTTAKFKGLLL
jgi:hypothetical protein